MFGSALLRREGVRGFGFGIGCLGVIQMTWDGHRQVGIGPIGVGTVMVVTSSNNIHYVGLSDLKDNHSITLSMGRETVLDPSRCHGSTSSPSALMRGVLRGGVMVLEGAGILARGTGSCT